METSQVADRYKPIEWVLDERMWRLALAAKAKVLGHGGITAIAAATGVSRRAIHGGLKEMESRRSDERPSDSRIRIPRACRKKVTDLDTTPLADLEFSLRPPMPDVLLSILLETVSKVSGTIPFPHVNNCYIIVFLHKFTVKLCYIDQLRGNSCADMKFNRRYPYLAMQNMHSFFFS